MASLTVIEKANQGQSDEPAGRILEKLEKNPFGVFRFMELDAHSNRTATGTSKQPYNRKKVLNHLKSVKDPFATLETDQETPVKLNASIAVNTQHTLAALRVPNRKLVELKLEGKLVDYARELAALFPQLDRTTISVNSDMNEFYEEQGLDWLPPCFDDFLNWYHLISPAAYEPYFGREELLRAPAYQVKEVQIGEVTCIEFISFESPLGFTQNPEETAAKVIEISEYLNAHRRDRQPVPAIGKLAR